MSNLLIGLMLGFMAGNVVGYLWCLYLRDTGTDP